MIATDLHAETIKLVALLKEVPKGETISLRSISHAIGRDITMCRHYLYSAMKVLERDHSVAFATVRGKGYRRLEPAEAVKVGQTARAHIRSTARRGMRTIKAVIAGANDLTDDQTRRILAEQSALGMLEHLAREKHLPKIDDGEAAPQPVAVAARNVLMAMGAIGPKGDGQ